MRGRPAKLYRRAADEVSVSLPDRRYDLAGAVLADAIELSLTGEVPLPAAVSAAAAAAGARVADRAAPTDRRTSQLGGSRRSSRRRATSLGSTTT